MGKLNASLILYIVAGVLFVLSVCINNEEFSLMVKPIIIPAIFVYYFNKVKGNIDGLFVLSLFLFFIGDMLYLLGEKDFYEIGLIIYALPYLLILFFLIRDLRFIFSKKKKLDYTFIGVLVFLFCLLLSVLNVLDVKSTELFVFYFVFGLELVLMGVFTTILIFQTNNKSVFFMAIAVTAFILSDLFFILNKEFFELKLFKLINASTQTLSYYFYVKYYLEKDNFIKHSI